MGAGSDREQDQTQGEEQQSDPAKSGWTRLWGQGWARTGVSGLVGWDLQADALNRAIDP